MARIEPKDWYQDIFAQALLEYQNFDSGISWAHKNKTYLVFVQVDPEHVQFINNRQAAGLNHIAFQGIA